MNGDNRNDLRNIKWNEGKYRQTWLNWKGYDRSEIKNNIWRNYVKNWIIGESYL